MNPGINWSVRVSVVSSLVGLGKGNVCSIPEGFVFVVAVYELGFYWGESRLLECRREVKGRHRMHQILP